MLDRLEELGNRTTFRVEQEATTAAKCSLSAHPSRASTASSRGGGAGLGKHEYYLDFLSDAPKCNYTEARRLVM